VIVNDSVYGIVIIGLPLTFVSLDQENHLGPKIRLNLQLPSFITTKPKTDTYFVIPRRVEG